jgi:hypothetical protein
MGETLEFWLILIVAWVLGIPLALAVWVGLLRRRHDRQLARALRGLEHHDW